MIFVVSLVLVTFLCFGAYYLRPETNEVPVPKVKSDYTYSGYVPPKTHFIGKMMFTCPGEKYCNFPGLH